jgi:ATP-dependent NAD(P)H-hydrate dehydratase
MKMLLSKSTRRFFSPILPSQLRTKLPLASLISAWFICTGHSFTTSQTASCTSFTNMKVWDDGRNESLHKCILPLSSNSHKGSSGRIGVLGGSAQYTGAPYYAAMASLQAGSDLAYIFTAQEAVTAIKCYSPELMVTPVYSATEFSNVVKSNSSSAAGGRGPADLDTTSSSGDTEQAQAQLLVDNMVQQVTESMSRLHCLVIGPGLGRCPLVMKAVAKIITKAREQNLFLILDADALYMLSLPEYNNLVQGYDKVILTPNIIEYKRLFGDDYDRTDTNTKAENGSKSDEPSTDANFASAVIVLKGKHDEIYRHGAKVMVCEEEGGLKRSGGIGDVLAGTLSTLCAWHVILKDRNVATDADLPLSCWTACCFIKRATKRAFDSKRRAMTAPDVLNELGPSIDTMAS